MSLFRVFLWKNFKYIRYHWLRTTLIFIASFILLTIVLALTYSDTKQREIVFDPVGEEEYNSYFSSEPDDVIFYAPSTPFLDELMNHVRHELSIIPTRMLSFPDKNEMSFSMEQKKNTRSFSIFFEQYPRINGTEREDLKYFIGATHGKASTAEIFYNDRDVVGIQAFDDYVSNGFFALQNAIDKKFVELQTGHESYMVEIGPFPRIELDDIDSFRVIFFGMLFMMFLYIILLTTFIVPLVEEKQDGMQAYLSFATSSSYLNRLTFYMIMLVAYVIFLAVSLLIAGIYDALGGVCVIFTITLFVLFLLASMNYAFLISVFLKSVFFAKIGGFLAFCVPTVLFSIEGSMFNKLEIIASGNIFLNGLRILQIFTNKRREMSFHDLCTRIADSNYTLCEVYGILIAQCIVYIALYNYLSNLFPGAGGIRKPFYYVFNNLRFNWSRSQDGSECCLNSPTPIKIRKLVKEFSTFNGKTNVVVNNLNMEVENKKITALLGHNGAGKTTTINMIIGSVEKTSGDIIVFGEKDVEMYRNSIGYCPQHNIFMQYLTCKDHLYFFSMLRGQTHNEAEQEATDLLSQLLLKEKAQEVGEKLSGGMKRRLALGMSIAGKTLISILDEPTSGLDPESRRTLWDILLKIRKTRSILITTHYMEEAETLGDEIAIMSHGNLVCTGTPMDLKRNYGSGFILKLLTEGPFKINKTMDLIHQYVPCADIYSIVEPTVCISLPYDDRKNYSELLRVLERKKTDLGISYFSVTNSSLEDVFLNCVGKDEPDTLNQPQSDRFKKDLYAPKPDAVVAPHQSLAVFYKKYVFIKRKWLYSLTMCLIPLFTIAVSFWAMNADTTFSLSDHPLNLKVNVPSSEVFIKLPPNYSQFSEILSREITAMKCTPKFFAPHESLEEALLNEQKKNITHFYDRIYGAVEIEVDATNKPIVKILYSTNMIHSSVTLLNLVDNVLLKYESGKNISITTHNIPIKKSIIVSAARLEYYSSMVPVGWFFYMLFFVTLPFLERKTEFSKLQKISRPIYWISYTLSDICFLGFICVLSYFVHFLFDTKIIYNSTEIATFTLTFLFYGIAYLPVLYILANSFRSMSSLSTCLFIFLIISTIIPIVTSTNRKAMETYCFVIAIMMFLPDYALKHQLMSINENYFIQRRNSMKEHSNPSDIDYANYRQISEEPLNVRTFFFYMAFVLAVAEIFLIFVWDRIYRRQWLVDIVSIDKCKERQVKMEPVRCSNDDGDVTDGKDVLDGSTLHSVESDGGRIKAPSLSVNNLHKIYDYGKVHAVRGIDFSVNPGECFGLLGLNGAGKSSTFKMITGCETISKGSVSIKGIDSKMQQDSFNALYGYCPQTDALNNFMTSYEILKYIALLRGVSVTNVDLDVMYWLKQLDLLPYTNVPVQYYSGGTKRKLNTAMALIGNPTVIFLDEPTTGVDPKSRRFMWKCIQDLQKNDRTVILTSHSMDECENLCNRLAIMASGEFKCLDYIPKLKEKYGNHFTITLKLKPECTKRDLGEIEADLEKKIVTISNNAEFEKREQHGVMVTYSVKAKPSWSKIFHVMEELIKIHETLLSDYSISETTLEDIFLKMKM